MQKNIECALFCKFNVFGSFCDIAGGLPRKFDLISFYICTLSLSVNSFDLVSIGEVPASCALWLIEPKVTLKVGSIWIEPFAAHKLSIFELSDVLLSG